MSSSETIKIQRNAASVKILRFPVVQTEQETEPMNGTAEEEVRNNEKVFSSISPIYDEQAVNEAFQRGIEEGNRRAAELLQQEYNGRIAQEHDRLTALMETLQQRLALAGPDVEKALTNFSLAVAENIIRKEVQIDTSIIEQIIKDGIRKIIGIEKITISLNPQDAALFREKKHTLQSASESLREITFLDDPAIERGGCILESDIGNVDARIATQIEQVRSIINNSYH
ncbi:MAG: hypothetical protein H3C35_01110 [Bacteroidetes bacterium]|nr:hypothetical protein [Bacteroidota bacterium]